MEERLRFVAHLLEGEPITDLCRQFGISRKTGLAALSGRSRRPVRHANQLRPQVESLFVSLKRDKPHWGARKLRELLLRRLAGDVRVPAKSTIHAVLDRHGLVKRARKRRNRAEGTPLSEAAHLTLKKEATRPPGANSLQQQARFDEFNTERPHEALAMKRPADL